MSKIRIQHVSRHYAAGTAPAVDDISLTIDAGEIFVLMGLSGSGKSTLLRMLNGLVKPTAGSVLIDDVDIQQLKPRGLVQLRRNKLSMVFQSFALMPQLRVLANVEFGLDIAGIPAATRRPKALSLLAQVGLADYADYCTSFARASPWPCLPIWRKPV